MKYSSIGKYYLAASIAVLACFSQTALYAQSQTATQGNNPYDTQSGRQVYVGQPASPPPTVTIRPTGPAPMPGPAQVVSPPVVRTGAPVFGQPTWGGPVSSPTISSGPVYGRLPYGTTVYGPGYGQPAMGERRVQITIPDVSVQPTAMRPAEPAIPTAEPGIAEPGVRRFQGVSIGSPVPPQNRTIYTYTPPSPAPAIPSGGPNGNWNPSPNFLGGYYFSNYCSDFSGVGSYPSAYSLYPGFPGFIYEPGAAVVVFSPPVFSPYVGNYIPFDAGDFANRGIEQLYAYHELTTDYNPFLYHGPLDTRPPAQQAPPAESAPQAPATPSTSQPSEQQPSEQPSAPQYPAGSYKEAFADIESGWINGDVDSIRKHLRDNDLKIAVSLNGKYSYSISSGDWADITRDALDHLQTVSFEFTLLRFQKNGDITGYAKQVYSAEGKDGDKQDTMYLAYTLRHRNNAWYIVAVDSSPKSLIKEQKDQPAVKTDDQSAPVKPDNDGADSGDSGK